MRDQAEAFALMLVDVVVVVLVVVVLIGFDVVVLVDFFVVVALVVFVVVAVETPLPFVVVFVVVDTPATWISSALRPPFTGRDEFLLAGRNVFRLWALCSGQDRPRYRKPGRSDNQIE